MISKYSNILDDCNANGIDGRSWQTVVTGLWFSPAVRILLSHRIQRRLKEKGGAFRVALARMLWMRTVNKWGCDIGNQAEIAPGLHLPHPVGVVIGNFTVVEAGCAIYQNVTLGDCLGKNPGRPTVRAGSIIYAHAVVLGPVEIKGVVRAQELVMPPRKTRKAKTA